MSVAALTEQLVAPEEANKAADSAKRQMALRALGELKDEAGLAAIEPYLKSPDPLLADYAKAAQAAIKGEKYKRPTVSKDALRNDLTLLPSGLGAIGGMTMEPGSPMNLVDEMKKLGMLGMPEPEEAEAMMVQSLSQVASMVGNFRLGAVTFGVASDVGDDTGSVVVIVRGLYNSKALDAMLSDRIGGVRKKAGGLTYHELDSDTAYVAPVSDELLVFTVGANGDQLPLAEVGAKVVAGGGDFALGKDLAQMLDKAEIGAPAWALAKVTEAYAQAPFLAPFDTLTLGSEKIDGGKSRLKLSATGTDAEGAAEVVKQMNEGIAEMREGAAEAAESGEMPKSITDMMASIKVATEGGNATLSAEIGSANAMAMMPFFLFSARAAAPMEIEAEELQQLEALPEAPKEKVPE
jgi:hypothetical protein